MQFYRHLALAIALSSTGLLSACSTVSQIKENNQVSSKAVSVATLKLNPEKMMAHLNAFQTIAQQNGGNRAVGTKGGLASAQYIVDLAKKTGFNVQMLPFENREKTRGQNILVEIEGQSKDSVILLGAHYDSVLMGPGINDNASGVAVLLELMNQLSVSQQKPKHTIVLAFWDSEEVGIAGSHDYVKKLTAEQLKGIKAYINVDMVGTKDPDVMIADGDKSSLDEMAAMLKERGMNEEDYKPLIDDLRSLPNHSGDLALENSLKTFFQSKKMQVKEDVTTLTLSDTAAFLGKVPVSAIILFNQQLNGNNLEYATCYHKACDSIEHVDIKSLEIAGQAIIHLLNEIQS